jgi:multiple sugar transport system substrate-binding protein
MKRTWLVIVSLALVAAACTATGSSGPASPVNTGSGASHAPVTLNVWSFDTAREFKQYTAVLDEFARRYPWITINHTGSKSDANIIQAINAGTPPDVAITQGPDNVARFCSTGAYQDLNPYMKADNLDITKIIPASALAYTSYQGDQCSLPALSDAYGLYYNNDMFAAANLTTPPKTLSQLETYAKKLTTYNSDGSIKVAGFVPLDSFYENAALYLGDYSASQWYQSDGKSALATDPTWASLLTWEKQFITNVYGPDGYDKLIKFIAGVGGGDSEFSSSNAFEVGKVAMLMDGEWRTAFIKDDKANVNYSTAPFPVADAIASTYGRGQIGGDVLGVPRGAANSAEAWLLVKYLATDTSAEKTLAEELGNVPTTFEALKDPKLTQDPHFKIFLSIFANPNSGYKQLTPIGDADQNLFKSFVDLWEAGKVSNLQQGLQKTATQIDQQASLG